MPDMPFEEHSIRVSPGDTLFVYTDGLTDRLNAAGDFYSIDRIAKLLEQSTDHDLDSTYETIYGDITAFVSTEEFRDDIAFVVTRFQ
jgi:sigma-B regulation protein RsbU (phosphoserine phosphatase)